MFAITALIGELISNRDADIKHAVNYSYTIADKMFKARMLDDRNPSLAEYKSTESVANKIINQMKGFDHGF